MREYAFDSRGISLFNEQLSSDFSHSPVECQAYLFFYLYEHIDITINTFFD